MIYKDFLLDKFEINPKVYDFIQNSENELSEEFNYIDEICSINQLKVLSAFQENHINDSHFSWNTGYGYDDSGRDAVERVYASIFNTDTALVRTGIVNGTHAISTVLFGLLRSGDELIYATGEPYDTLKTVIGTMSGSISSTASSKHLSGKKQVDNASNFEYKDAKDNEDKIHNKGTLLDYGIKFKSVPLKKDGHIDLDLLKEMISDKTKVIALQRSTGYAWRSAISLSEIKEASTLIKSIDPSIIIFVDNCYGEFIDSIEPTDIGVDIIAGSLIKNPGGGFALSGGYIAGREELVKLASYRLTCPGIGDECGLTFGQNRTILQGLFIAPKVVNSAAKGALLCGLVYDKLGFMVCPPAKAKRNDIVQAIKFNDPEKMVTFCQSIQAASPIDSYVTPIPWEMPGYDDKVVMAAGNFVQGSSIELSADAPMREPYIAYFQGGLTYEHSKYGVIKSLDLLVKKGLIDDIILS